MNPPRSVSFVVPMYNEEDSLRLFLRLAREALDTHVGDGEIVLVDDGSKDATLAIAREEAAADPRLRVVVHERNRGLGAALRTGFAAATREWVLYTDCDVPWDLDNLGRVFRVAEITGCGLVSGYRHDRTGEGPLRTLYSFVYNGLIGILFGVRIRDVNFSCKLFRRELLNGVELKSEGSFIDAELIARFVQRGVVMQQIGIDYFPRTRGVSTLSSPKVVLRILREMGRLASDIREEKRRVTRV